MKKLEILIESRVDIPRMKIGEGQSVETLINEEALLFSKYLRHERKDWIPRMK